MKSNNTFSVVMMIVILIIAALAFLQFLPPSTVKSDATEPATTPTPAPTSANASTDPFRFSRLDGTFYLQTVTGNDKDVVIRESQRQVKQLVNSEHSGDLHVNYASIPNATISHKNLDSWIKQYVPDLNDTADIQYKYVFYSLSSQTYQVPLVAGKDISKGDILTLIMKKSNSGYVLTGVYCPY
jgi:hypothetical protein